MAVCQGRISEGIDFSDAEGRCVVVIGIPFAPAKDPRVLCKRQVLDERCRAGLGTLSGQQWWDPFQLPLIASTRHQFSRGP
jgi:regulator of telomere elongation helicase 1